MPPDIRLELGKTSSLVSQGVQALATTRIQRSYIAVSISHMTYIKIKQIDVKRGTNTTNLSREGGWITHADPRRCGGKGNVKTGSGPVLGETRKRCGVRVSERTIVTLANRTPRAGYDRQFTKNQKRIR